MTMDYNPWSEREIWPFVKVAISPKPETLSPPKLVCVHLTSIYSCINFLNRFRSIEFFDDHGLESIFRRENLAVFDGSSISETGKVTPTKIGVHACDINL